MTRKLSLDLVTSFDTSDERAQAGSVNGHEVQGPAAITRLPGAFPAAIRLTCSTNVR